MHYPRSESKNLIRPHFIIIGAMKCGTTSLHHTLEQHPDVYFPTGEMKFFTIDDFEQQYYFFPYQSGKWTDHDFETRFDDYKEWYRQQYKSIKNESVLGEDAPSYLSSRKAPERIARLFPNTKFIVILRDPVDRLYSHYWHSVNNFSAFLPLEESIRYMPGLLFDRSCYKKQIEYYFNFFRRDQFHFVVFERFVKEPSTVLAEIQHFLGLNPIPLDVSHANRSKYPRFLHLRLFRNRTLKHLNARNYFDFLPDMPPKPDLSIWEKVFLQLEHQINLSSPGPKPSMKENTKSFLQRLLKRENEGLDELIGIDLHSCWPTFQP